LTEKSFFYIHLLAKKKCSTSPAVENFQLLFDLRQTAPKNSELNFSVAKIFARGSEMRELKTPGFTL
jgi:hypothetical protein